MTTYQIQLQGDTLKVDFGTIPADGDRILRDAVTRVKEMIASGEIKGGNLLKINGRISILVSYALAHELVHLYRAIALADTRLGAYIVAISTASEYPVGSRIDFTTGEVKLVATNSISPPSFLIYWEDGILIAKINNGMQVDGDQILRDAEAQLENLISSGQLSGGKQLLINGRATNLASFVIASKVAHIYGSVAVFDPKQGDKGLDRYVVVISHGEKYQVGDIVDIDRESQSSIKVVLCGFPNTGKTVLRDGLKAAILKLKNAPDDFYSISGCPDGDGSWYSETIANYPDLANQLKEEYKRKFTREFAIAKAREIKLIKNSLLLFDVGGKIPIYEDKDIMSGATHAVILAKTEEDVTAWKEVCEKRLAQYLPVIAILYSDFEGKNDEIISESPVLIGKVHHLHRGENVSSRPMVQALAKCIVDLV